MYKVNVLLKEPVNENVEENLFISSFDKEEAAIMFWEDVIKIGFVEYNRCVGSTTYTRLFIANSEVARCWIETEIPF